MTLLPDGIPLFETLTEQPIPIGSNLLVEFDASSLWLMASITIAADWLRTGGNVVFNATAQPPDDVRNIIGRLGLDSRHLENNGKLDIHDIYSHSLGKITDKKRVPSSLTIRHLRTNLSELVRWPVGSSLRIWDNGSALVKFNDEKSWVEFELTHDFVFSSRLKSTLVLGIMNEVHADWVYKTLERAADGIIDFKLDKTTDFPRNVIRIKNMRNVGFDERWHLLKVNERFEVTSER